MKGRTAACSLVALFVVLVLGSMSPLMAQGTTSLDDRVSRLESQTYGKSTTGLLAFLFGAFCALWAQNTGRSAWAWFFLGCFFGPLTVIALLLKNSQDRHRERAAS